MTVKEYLSQVETINAKLENIRSTKEELRDQMGRAMGISYDGERVQTSVHGDALFNRTIKLMELEADYDRTESELAEVKAKIISEIHCLNSAEEIRVLYLRYIECLRFDQIAEEISYSERHVRRIRDRALESFADAFPDKFKTE